MQAELKKTREKYEGDLKQRDQFLSKLIQKSIDLKNQVMTIDEKKNPAHKKTNMFSHAQTGELMSELELKIAKLMELKEESGSMLMEMRDHLIEVYTKVGIGLLKRHLFYDEMLLK